MSWCLLLSCCCSVTKSCPTLCDPMDCTIPGFSVLHHLPKLAQAHVHWVGVAIQPSHPRSSCSPPAFNLSQYQGLFQWVHSSHQVAKILELQHQSLQWICSVDFFRIDWFDLLADSYQKLNLLAPSSRTSQSPELLEINICCFSHLLWAICNGSFSKLIYMYIRPIRIAN